MEKIDKKLQLLNSWLKKYHESSKFAKDVSQVKELTEYQKNILENIPKDNNDVKNDLEDNFTSDIEYIEKTLPTIDIPKLYSDSSINAIAVSGSTGGYAYLQNTVNDSPDFITWKRISLNSLAEIQERQNRFDEIINTINEIDSTIANEFRAAQEIFPLYKQGLNKFEELGTIFRNPMEHFKGRLWERAKRICKNESGRLLKGKPKWAIISEYTAKNGVGSQEYIELIEMWTDYDEIFGFLSSMLKKCASYTEEYIIEQIHKYIDVIYSILKLSDIEKIKNAL